MHEGPAAESKKPGTLERVKTRQSDSSLLQNPENGREKAQK